MGHQLCGCGCGSALTKDTQHDFLRGHSHRGKKLGPREKTIPVAERFWKRVHIVKDGCWIRSGAHNGNGYTVISTKQGRIYAHRFSWELHFGPIPGRLEIAHHCDNPPCVRPDHLFLATHAENMADASAKGRYRARSQRLKAARQS